jgi:hypothetical protein
MLLQSLDIVIGFVVVMLGVSLIITTITQMISALLGLRGTNLRWGLKTLLSQAGIPDPETVAKRVLKHPLISDSTFSKFFSRLFDRWKLASAIRCHELTGILQQLAMESKKPPLSTPEINQFINDWFDPVMDRVSQRFAMSMRFWTVGLAIALAFGLQLDSIELFRRLSEDRALRTKLVASAETILQKSEAVLDRNGSNNVYTVALQELKRREPAVAKLLTNTPALTDSQTANLWLRSQLRESAEADQWISLYGQIVSSNLVARTPEMMGSIQTVQDLLGATGLQLIPDNRNWTWSQFRCGLFGMLISAVFLSLRAPFWFNGLKTLMNLRPVLATRVEKEKSSN